MNQKEEIIIKIREWTSEASGTIQDISYKFPGSKEIVYEIISKHDPELPEVKYYVQFPEEVSDAFRLYAYVQISEEDRKVFHVLHKGQKQEFVNMLKISVMSLNLSYEFIPNLNEMEFIQITKMMYFDGFNKNLYVDWVTSLIHGYEIVTSLYCEFKYSIK